MSLFGIILIIIFSPLNLELYNKGEKNNKIVKSSAWTGNIKYDFENDTIGSDPSGPDLSIYESPANGYVEVDIIDGRKCVVINKTGGTDRVYLKDKIGISNYTKGTLHFLAYHDNASFAIVIRSANNELIIDMPWRNGMIQYNLNGSPFHDIVAHPIDQWVEIILHFDLSQGWMFDINDTRYGAGYAFPFWDSFTAGVIDVMWASFYSGGGNGDFCVDNIGYSNMVPENPQIIDIITPENKTYFQPMSGYYPATIGLENDAVGELPSFIDQYKLDGGTIRVIEEIDGHKKVVELSDTSYTEYLSIADNFSYSFGTIEFWIRMNDTSKDYWIDLSGDTQTYPTSFVRLRIMNNVWRYTDYNIYKDVPNVPVPKNNSWHRITIHFRCLGASPYKGLNNNKWKCIIDGVDSGELSPRGNDESYVKRLNLRTNDALGNYNIFLDAIGYSWDPYYNIGDNLNEGLLLSFTPDDLDWTEYSLDGQLNRTILGNTTIPFADDGHHAIQVFGNDSLGTMYQSSIRNFMTVDIIAPEIIINYPQQNQKFGDTAPNFNITVIEKNLNEIWYTLDEGLVNITCGTLGQIDQQLWNALSPGNYVLRFYANDVVENEGFSEVLIKKEEEPVISNYNPIIISFMIIIGIVVIVYKIKQKLN